MTRRISCACRRRALRPLVRLLPGAAFVLAIACAPAEGLARARKHTPEEIAKDLSAGKSVLGFSLAKPKSAVAAEKRDLDQHTAMRVAGDTLEVRYDVDRNPLFQPPPTRMHIFYAGEKPVAVALLSQAPSGGHVSQRGENREWSRAEFTYEFSPVDFAGWSSSYGCVYSTATPGVYLGIPRRWRPEAKAYLCGVHVLRILDPAGWAPSVVGEWTPWAGIGPDVGKALAARDGERLRALLSAREMPILGAAVDAFEAIAAADSDGHFADLRRRAEAADGWPERVAALHAIRAQWDEWNLVNVMMGRVRRQERSVDLSRIRAQLDRIARTAMPEAHSSLGAYDLVRAAALRKVFGDTLDRSIVQAWVDRFRPDVENVSVVSQGRMDLTTVDDGVDASLVFALGARWRNEPGHGHKVQIRLDPVDLSGVVRREVDYRSRSGGWVAASREQMAEQAEIDAMRRSRDAGPARLREIERELEALDSTPVGEQVLGSDPGVKQYRTVDGAGRTYVTEVSAGRRSVYLKGVRADLERRNRRRVELRAERERIQSLMRNLPPSGRVVDGKVWSDQAGDLTVTPLVTYHGPARRDVVLVGDGFESRVEQEGMVYDSYPVGSDITPDEFRRKVEVAFDTGTKWGYAGSSLRAAYKTAVRRSFAKIVEHEAGRITADPPDVVAADLAWALGMFHTYRFVSDDLYFFIVRE